MPSSRILLFAGALGFSLCSALIVRAWIETARSETPPPTAEAAAAPAKPITKVLVAAKPLPTGHIVKSDDLKWQSWPDDDLLPAYIVEGKGPSEELAGGVVRSRVGTGEPITDQQIVRRGDRGLLAAVLAPGYRAITLSIGGNIGLSGLVVPGDRVDIIVSLAVNGQEDGPGERRLTQTVLRDVRVIAIDQNIDVQKSDNLTAHTATLEVTPKQAELLVLVGDLGKVSLSLRSVADSGAEPPPSPTWDVDASAALVKARHLAKPPPLPGEKVGVVRGTAASEVDFGGMK